MEYIKLGLTDLQISRLGFGCWAIGGHGYGKVDDNESIKAIRCALDHGINFFDTADTYGFGHSEEILARGLGDQKKEVVIATKFGVVWDDNGSVYWDCSPKRVVEALEGSLRRLKIDCIPLYQIHRHDNKTPIYETLDALVKCQRAGKIKYISCTNFPSSLIRSALSHNRIESLQCLYNIIQRENEKDMLECYESLHMGIITYGTLARGLLSGKFDDKPAMLDEKDTRANSDMFKADKFRNNLQLIEKLKVIAARYNKKCSHVALKYVLSKHFVTCALVGHKTVSQVEDNVESLGWGFEQQDMEYLDKLCDDK